VCDAGSAQPSPTSADAAEICGNGIDDDGDLDEDGDGVGTCSGDCDDSNAAVSWVTRALASTVLLR